MSAPRLIWVCVWVAACALAITACSSSHRQAAIRADGDRQKAPEFELKDANGTKVRLSDYRGKVVLLDFWATWCGPCKIEIPWFMDFERRHKDQGFAVVGVSMDEDGWSAIRPFMSEMGVNYRVLLGDDKTGEQYGGIEALPTTFLIDREGRIAAHHIGLAGRQDFEDEIEKLLQTGAGQRSAMVRSDGRQRTD